MKPFFCKTAIALSLTLPAAAAVSAVLYWVAAWIVGV